MSWLNVVMVFSPMPTLQKDHHPFGRHIWKRNTSSAVFLKQWVVTWCLVPLLRATRGCFQIVVGPWPHFIDLWESHNALWKWQVATSGFLLQSPVCFHKAFSELAQRMMWIIVGHMFENHYSSAAAIEENILYKTHKSETFCKWGSSLCILQPAITWCSSEKMSWENLFKIFIFCRSNSQYAILWKIPDKITFQI